MLNGAFRSFSYAKVQNFNLMDQFGYAHELYRYSWANGIVLISHGNGCAILQKSLPKIRELKSKYSPSGIVFLMINANPQDSRESIEIASKEFGVETPILKDETQTIAKSLGIKRTAETYLINPKRWEILYHGPIDDRLGFGTERRTTTKNYLEDSIKSLIRGLKAPALNVENKGCLIQYEKIGKKDETISYTKDVVPILIGRCLPCHKQGGVAPWAMTSYKQVKGWSSMIEEVIKTKRMPPWHADPRYGKFENDRSLTLEEEKMLLAWIASGSPRDGKEDSLRNVGQREEEKWPLGKPDMILTLPEIQKIPAKGVIDYRYFKIQPKLESDVWIRGAHLRPSNPKVLHHGFAFVEYLDHLQEKEPKRKVGIDDFLAMSAPGRPIELLPQGTGMFLPKGATFRFELHYTATGKPETDCSELGLYFYHHSVPKELRVKAVRNTAIEILPGARDHEVQASTLLEKDVLLYELFPHMHYRGIRMSLEAHYPNGHKEILLSVPRYDFKWQNVYRLAVPKKLPKGTKLVCVGAFDNSSDNPSNPDPSKTVRWGRQSSDEMFIGYFAYTEES